MKRHGNLYGQITTYGNLLLAHLNARRGKTGTREVQTSDQKIMDIMDVASEALGFRSPLRKLSGGLKSW